MMTPLATSGERQSGHARRVGRRATFVRLHLRARGIPMFVVGVAIVAVVGWAAAEWLVDLPWSQGPSSRRPVAVAAPLVAAVLASLGLGGRDEELERSTAVRWWLYRLGTVVATTVVIGAALALTGLWEPRVFGAFELVRNAVGFAGLLAIGVVVVGARLAWIPAFGYATVVAVVGMQPLPEGSAWWLWPVEPWTATAAAWSAAMVFVVGLGSYMTTGARPSRDIEE